MSQTTGSHVMAHFQKLLEDLEAVAEEVICDRQEIISLDRRRNTNREALRALCNAHKNKNTSNTETDAAASPNTCAQDEVARCLITEIPGGSSDSIPLRHDSMVSTKVWMCIGDMFIRMPKNTVVEAIKKEQEQLDKGISELRDGLRGKINTLRKLEGEEPTRGTHLSPLNKEEWEGVRQVMGGRC